MLPSRRPRRVDERETGGPSVLFEMLYAPKLRNLPYWCGVRDIARAFSTNRLSVTNWLDRGYIPPPARTIGRMNVWDHEVLLSHIFLLPQELRFPTKVHAAADELRAEGGAK